MLSACSCVYTHHMDCTIPLPTGACNEQSVLSIDILDSMLMHGTWSPKGHMILGDLLAAKPIESALARGSCQHWQHQYASIEPNQPGGSKWLSWQPLLQQQAGGDLLCEHL